MLKLHPGEAQTETEHGMMVLRHGGAPLVVESGVGRTKGSRYTHKQKEQTNKQTEERGLHPIED